MLVKVANAVSKWDRNIATSVIVVWLEVQTSFAPIRMVMNSVLAFTDAACPFRSIIIVPDTARLVGRLMDGSIALKRR